MKKYLVMCMVALMVGAAAFPYTILESTRDSVTFEFECMGNKECREPGEEYCGIGEVYTMQCVDDVMCEIECYEFKANDADDWWEYTDISITPTEKKAGEPVVIELKDSRHNTPLVWEINIYKGGGWESVETQGAIHIAENKWGYLEEPITMTRWVRGELFTQGPTNRQGVASFTPDEPGYYSILTTGKDIAFLVGDEEGNTFYCGNDECEAALGEDELICSKDCGESAVIPDVPDEPEGDTCTPEGSSDGGECCEGLTRIGHYAIKRDTGECAILESLGPCAKCGDGTCSPWEDVCNCPPDCTEAPAHIPPPKPAEPDTTQVETPPGEDMTMKYVLVAIVVIIVGVLVFILFQKSKRL